MFSSRPFKAIVIFILIISIAGCGALQKKFTRKKKKDERIIPVVTTYDYSKELRVEELYKKHYLFWKSWHQELIDRIDSTVKKRITCYYYTITSLTEMQKYLKEPKKEELNGFINEIKSIELDVKKMRLTKSEKFRLRKLLEKTRRDMLRKFSFSDVSEFLTLNR